MIPVDETTFRPCGGCTVCCQATAITPLNKPCGVRCANLVGEGESAGCSVYEQRPHDPKFRDCISFHCLWQRGEFDESDRPDRVGVAFGQRPDRERPGQMRIDAWEVTPGAAQSPRAMELIGGLLQSDRNVVIINADYQLAFVSGGDAWHCWSNPADPLRSSVDPNFAPVQITSRGRPLLMHPITPDAPKKGRAWYANLRLPFAKPARKK